MLDLFPWNPRITYIETSKIDRMECIFCGPILRPIIGPRVIQKLSQRGYIWFCWVLPIAPTHVAPKAHWHRMSIAPIKIWIQNFFTNNYSWFFSVFITFRCNKIFLKICPLHRNPILPKIFPKKWKFAVKNRKICFDIFPSKFFFGGKFFMLFLVLCFNFSVKWAFGAMSVFTPRQRGVL